MASSKEGAREDRVDGIAFTVVADGDASCVLGEEKAQPFTPINEDDTLTVIFDEIRGKVFAEDWEREVTKLFPHDWLPSFGWGLLRLCHRGRLPPSYLGAACRSCECNCAGVCKIVAICAQ